MISLKFTIPRIYWVHLYLYDKIVKKCKIPELLIKTDSEKPVSILNNLNIIYMLAVTVKIYDHLLI